MMKVFLSYGHDQNAPLVERIARDLEVAGHSVWIDRSQIKAGDDWRLSIVDGLSDTDWVLGFLSKHATRDPGVCLDELAIALHVKGGAIATVLVEGEAAAQPPVSMSHIQWLDMHDWAGRQGAGGPEWESWYRTKLGEILTLLASPSVQRFAGDIKELDRRLRPITQAADIGLLVDGFVGREWLQAKLDDWRRSAKDSRLFWLSGAAGTGKSAFAAWLAHRGKVNVIGLNLCRYNVDERRDAGRVIRTLAFQIATRLPDYRRLILDRLSSLDANGTELARKSPAALFDWLVIEPLHLAIDGGRREDRYLVVIDALDETVRDGRSELAEVLAEHASKLPAWMAMVVTSRPEEPILRQFAGLQPTSITAESPENLDDLRAYARAWLTTLNLATGDLTAAIDRVVAASAGNFLYLRMCRLAVTQGILSLAAPEGLPRGLIGLYERWFRHRFPDPTVYASYVPLLSVLAAAEHPVPEPWLAKIFGWSAREQAGMLEGLGSLFERHPEGVAPFHKSLRDWLVDARAAGSDFVVDATEGTRRLADALWAEFVRWARDPQRGPLDPFCIAELPGQIGRLPPDEVRVRLAASSRWSTIGPQLSKVAGAQADCHAWENALAWWRMIAVLADAFDPTDQLDKSSALQEAGHILITLGRSTHALDSFRASLAIAERGAKAYPNNAGWQRNLSVSYTCVGDVLVAEGHLTEALKSYRDSVAIAQRLAQADPDNARWQRDLYVSYLKVGDVLVVQGNLAEAQISFGCALVIAERLAKAEPNNADTRRDLSRSYEKVGNVLREQGDLTEALQALRGSLAVNEGLAKAEPNNADWQGSLAVSYVKVGDMLVAQGNPVEALTAFRNALAIAERLAQADPKNVAWQRTLAVSYSGLGDALLAHGDLSEALQAYRGARAIFQRLAEADPNNAGWQRDLSLSYDKVGDVLKEEAEVTGDLTRALQVFRDSLAIREALAKADPNNAEWQRALALSYGKVAGVLQEEGDLAEALQAFRDSLVITERLATAEPDRPGWRRDLTVAHVKVGDVLVALDNPAEALRTYRDSLVIAERVAKAEPGNVECQRDLAVCCARVRVVGDMLVARGDLAEALNAFRDTLGIAERMTKADPNNASWQRDLMRSTVKVGDVLKAQGNLTQALQSYRGGLAIAERLATADPGHAGGQQDVATSHAKLASVMLGNLAEAVVELRRGRQIMATLASKAPDLAEWRTGLAWFDGEIARVESGPQPVGRN